MKLSENLKRIRKENNLSQEQLAEKLGVSRQAVSKWESNQSYPEMDKMLLICKLFNYNIDELINENVKEVDETKQSKINFNKYVNEFFGFITKTVDMFGVMKFGQKLKCIIEQCVVILTIIAIFAILGCIGSSIISNMLGSIPGILYRTIFNIFESIYLIICTVIGFSVLLHIFKIRYLDYYQSVKVEAVKNIVEEKKNENLEKDNNLNDNKKIFNVKNTEKVIIRDPEHSQFKFFSGIAKFIVICFKIFVIFVSLFFAFSLICLVVGLVLSFLFVKTGITFVGLLLGIIASILINITILEILYNFIVNKKNNKLRIGITFLASLILMGIGVGLIAVGVTHFNVESVPPNTLEDKYIINMQEDLAFIQSNINYIESDREDIEVIVKYNEFNKSRLYVDEDSSCVVVSTYFNDVDGIAVMRKLIEDINEKKIVDYSNYGTEIYVYTSKDNINKLKENRYIYH